MGGLGLLVDGGTPQKIEKAMCIPRVPVNKIYRYEIGGLGGEPLTSRFFEPLSHGMAILSATEKGKCMRPMPKLEVTELPVDELAPYANNAKEHPQKQIDEIAESISTFGNCDPIGVWHNEDGKPEIVEGHGRVLALKKLGITTAPVIYLDHLTDEQRRAYTHVHNQTTMSSGFDYEILVADMDNLNMNWEALGFEEFCFNETPPSVDEAADELPETVICKCKRGDIWQLGEHRIMCGNSANEADTDALFSAGGA
ncbi:MAG: ParB/Srx family N-terminal domain-containing protein [Atopobium sp.]|nr:ParB/Srx family N-terminal domain-containing protein [Atopobium sp.]